MTGPTATATRTFHSRGELETHQLERLNALLALLAERNAFWRPRLAAAGLQDGARSLQHFHEALPFTTKAELAADQELHPPYGTNLSFPLDTYTRLHQTSSTTGRPLRWLDTPKSWAWMLEGWRRVFEAAGMSAADRVFVAAGFGPFIGFWLAFDAASAMGCLAIPGGAMSSVTRLRAMRENAVTALSCTPTYALHLGEVARAEGLEVPSLSRIVVGGEPGGSVPATRARIEELWPGARVSDHYGMTELGPVTFQAQGVADVVEVMEWAHLAEIVDPETGVPLPEDSDALGELVVTNLGRSGSPVLRYRTGDLVRRDPASENGLRLRGGIVARADHMEVVRGVNLYPAAFDQVVREVGGVAEYQIELDKRDTLTEVRVRVEPAPECADQAALVHQLQGALRSALSLRVPVELAAAGELPRFELKARRWNVVE